jgi:serine/threonine protein kinase
MEYIDGPSLSKYLRTLHQNKGRLPLDQVVRLIRAVASALQYAHNNRVIHRDVKPGNILLTSPSRLVEVGKPLPEDFEPVLTDFGLVRFMDSHRQTTTGHIAGTPAYMSPEQARGEATDGQTDVYSLGVVLYELLSGDVPFDGESTVSILLKQVTEPPPPIPGLSPLLQNVLDRALAKDVERFQTPLDFAKLSKAVTADVRTMLHDAVRCICNDCLHQLLSVKTEETQKAEPQRKPQSAGFQLPCWQWL